VFEWGENLWKGRKWICEDLRGCMSCVWIAERICGKGRK